MSVPSLAGSLRLALFLALVVLLLGAAPLDAADSSSLFAFHWRSLVSTRSGIIQVSIVCVIIAICILIKR